MIQLICKTSPAYCRIIEDLIQETGLPIVRVEKYNPSHGEAIVYAGKVDKDLKDLLNNIHTGKHRVRLLISIEHNNIPEDDAAESIIESRRRGTGILIVTLTSRDHRIIREKLPGVPVVNIPFYTIGGGELRDLMPRDGGIITHSDKCMDIVEVARELEGVRFNPLIINYSERDCGGTPWIISIATDDLFKLTQRIIAGLIIDESIESHIVLNTLYNNTRPIIVCSNIETPMDSKIIIKTKCEPVKLVESILELFSRIEYYRRISSERPLKNSLESILGILREHLTGGKN